VIAKTQFAELAQPLPLDCGRELREVRIAYESYGSEDAPVILICHALTGDAHAAGDGSGEVGAGEIGGAGVGWWDAMIGAGRAFDTNRYRVICTNLLGGCRGTTGPSTREPQTRRPYGSHFPELTVADLVRAQRLFLKRLQISSLRTVAGASLGGMQALQFALDYPEFVESAIAIASTAALGAQGVALNAVARQAIRDDPDWQGGDYYESGLTPVRGLGLARRIGHVTYLSSHALAGKSRDGRLGVEQYLDAQSERFVKRFDANSYLLFSTALTRFELSDEQLRHITQPVLLVSFSSDWIYPPSDSEHLAAQLPKYLKN